MTPNPMTTYTIMALSFLFFPFPLRAWPIGEPGRDRCFGYADRAPGVRDPQRTRPRLADLELPNGRRDQGLWR